VDLIAFQYDRNFVLDALRQGEIDCLEHVSEAAEADLFRHLIRRQVIQRLAETYPTPRKKEEVPVWIYLSSELSLKLHGALRQAGAEYHHSMFKTEILVSSMLKARIGRDAA
jgi:hypothetical protein